MLRTIYNSISFFWAAKHLLSSKLKCKVLRTLKKALKLDSKVYVLNTTSEAIVAGEKSSTKENYYILNSGVEFKEIFQSIYKTIGKCTHSNVFPLNKYLGVVMAYLIVTSESKLCFDYTSLLTALDGNLGDLASTPRFIIGLLYSFEQVTSFNSPICEKKVALHYSDG